MKQNQKGRRGRHRNQSRRAPSDGRRDAGRSVPRNRNQARQQVEKFTSLAREALQSQNFVEAENCYQHAEYFQRILNELADSQPEPKPVKAAEAGDEPRPSQDSGEDQPPGQVISIEAGDPNDKDGGDSDDEALSA